MHDFEKNENSDTNEDTDTIEDSDTFVETKHVQLNSTKDLLCPFINYDVVEWFKDSVSLGNRTSGDFQLRNIDRSHEGTEKS